VLSLVFEACDTMSGLPSQRNSLATPIALSHVCRRWRRCALNMARLWNVVLFQTGDSVPAARALLERSRTAPLEVIFLWGLDRIDHVRTTPAVGHLDEVVELLGRIAGHASRITSLFFQAMAGLEGWDMLYRTLFAKEELLMPRLEWLSVCLPHQDRDNSVTVDAPRITSTSLRSLVLERVPKRDIGDLAGRNTTSLSIRFTSLSSKQLRLALRAMDALQDLTLTSVELIQDLDADDRGVISNARPVSHLRVGGTSGILTKLAAVLPFPLSSIPSLSLRCSLDVTTFEVEEANLLGVNDLEGIESLILQRRQLSITTSRRWQRSLGCLRSSVVVGVTADLLTGHPSLLDTVKYITLDLTDYSGFLLAVEGRGAALPNLEEVNVRVDNYFRSRIRTSGLHEHSIDFYMGSRIVAPRLKRVCADLLGTARPSVACAAHFMRVFETLSPDPDVSSVRPILQIGSPQSQTRCVLVFRGHIQAMVEYYLNDPEQLFDLM